METSLLSQLEDLNKVIEKVNKKHNVDVTLLSTPVGILDIQSKIDEIAVIIGSSVTGSESLANNGEAIDQLKKDL